MKKILVGLPDDELLRERLVAIQLAFAEVCNALAPLVRDTRCWNRVALHHMTYKTLRAQFPALGSQMVCNAIYSVCRTSRLVYQGRNSPFHPQRWGDKPLPLLRFADNCPVYFDRHTLSLKNGHLSLYTLDGRLRFELSLAPAVEALLAQGKWHEIVLSRRSDDRYQLAFAFADETAAPQAISALKADAALSDESASTAGESGNWTEYLVLDTPHE